MAEPPTDAAESCAFPFSWATLRERAFAFEGTVTEVSDAPDPKAPNPDMVPTVGARFAVHRWFSGGSSASVRVRMQREVRRGARLLVTGEPRWGGQPLDDAIAWECGFTAAYTPDLAAQWAAAPLPHQPTAPTATIDAKPLWRELAVRAMTALRFLWSLTAALVQR